MTALDRTFGMELEFVNRGGDIARALSSAGLSMQRTQHSYHCTCDHCRYYFGQSGNWLKVQSDSSCGGEVISSPLRWRWTDLPDGSSLTPNPWLLMRELERIMGHDLDVDMDQRCGMHVHVGARDLSERSLGRLNELVEHHEAVLFRLACGRRAVHRGYGNGFTYCRPLSAFNNKMELRALEKAKTAAVRDSAISKQKYVAANLMPLSSLGTVEFRLFEATRSARRMRFYTKLAVALVERAKRPRSPMGKPLHLGEAGDDSALEVFLEDLEHGSPDFIDNEFKEDAHWQWSEAPARWQRRVEFEPLPHFDRNEIRTDDPDQAVFCSDGHGNLVPLEGDRTPNEFGPPPSLSSWRYREDDSEPESYSDAYDEDAIDHETEDFDEVSVDTTDENLRRTFDPSPPPDWERRRAQVRERLATIRRSEP